MNATPTTNYYMIRHDSVVQENIDGEYIVISLESGTYYSFRNSAVQIWQSLDQGSNIDTIVEALGNRFTGEPDEIQTHCQDFVSYLEKESLIEEIPRPEVNPKAEIKETPPEPFLAPLIESYSDVQDLLLLDPVHDVTQAGWPTQPSENVDKR